jgi:putative N6-adenine-specific DNA methylase
MEMMYRANFQLHTAIRILKPIKRFKSQFCRGCI